MRFVRHPEMVFGVEQLVAYISQVMTLEPGDVILTGTPAGVGPLAHGDIVSVEIDGLGELSNPVAQGAQGAGAAGAAGAAIRSVLGA